MPNETELGIFAIYGTGNYTNRLIIVIPGNCCRETYLREVTENRAVRIQHLAVSKLILFNLFAGEISNMDFETGGTLFRPLS